MEAESDGTAITAANDNTTIEKLLLLNWTTDLTG